MSDIHTDTFVLDVKAIRERVRDHIASARAGRRDRTSTIARLLNEALAIELVCVLRYKRHYFMSATLGGLNGFAIVGDLLAQAKEDRAHADVIAERICELGGEPDFDPAGLGCRYDGEFVLGSELASMLRENVAAERIAIDTCGEIIRFIGDGDERTRAILEELQAKRARGRVDAFPDEIIAPPPPTQREQGIERALTAAHL